MDTEKYCGMNDHDLLIHVATQSDSMIQHLEKVNGQIDNNCKDIIKLKIIIAVIIAGGGAGAAKFISLLGG